MFNRRSGAKLVSGLGLMLTIGGVGSWIAGGTVVASTGYTVTAGTVAPVNNTPYSSSGKQCDPSRDGWHFIMNGLVYPAGASITSADFGPITITFSDGTTGTALFTDLAGGSTAHFLDSVDHQSGSLTVNSASMTFPVGSDITGYNNFVLSHPPCGTTTTTTTSSTTTTSTTTSTTTTTTIPKDTTTTSTTTTLPNDTTTSTTTTLPKDTTTTSSPTTSTPTTTSSPTTSSVAQEGPPPTPSSNPTTTATATDPQIIHLPVTGRQTAPIAIIGLLMFVSGLTMWGLARRPNAIN